MDKNFLPPPNADFLMCIKGWLFIHRKIVDYPANVASFEKWRKHNKSGPATEGQNHEVVKLKRAKMGPNIKIIKNKFFIETQNLRFLSTHQNRILIYWKVTTGIVLGHTNW